MREETSTTAVYGWTCPVCGTWTAPGVSHVCLGWNFQQSRPQYPPTTVRCWCLAFGEGTVTIRKPDREVTFILCKKHLLEAEQAAMPESERAVSSSQRP